MENQANQLGKLCAFIEAAHNSRKNKYGRVDVGLTSMQPISMLRQFIAVTSCISNGSKEDAELTRIVSSIEGTDFPEHLGLEDQGRFWLSYHKERKMLREEMFFAKVTITQHCPEEVAPDNSDHNIDELKK